MEQVIEKAALVAEIEKCYNECLNRAKITDSDYWNAKADAYRNVLVILNDTLEVQEEPASDDLEKAACNYGDELDNVLVVGIDDDNTVGEYATQAFKVGANWQKQKLMKQALDGILSSTITGSEQVVSAYVGYGELGKNGDKVKIVIIKED